jgi:hypothetical protein
MVMFAFITLAVMLNNSVTTFYNHQYNQYTNQNKVVMNNSKEINTVQMTGLELRHSLKLIQADMNKYYTKCYYTSGIQYKLNGSNSTPTNILSGLSDSATYTIMYGNNVVNIKKI